jgi:GDP-L-fucose synthase
MPDQPLYSLSGKRVWVAGDRGLVGSALVRRLASEDCEILTSPRECIDLRSAVQVDRWVRQARPQAVFLAAAKVGGIYANNMRPAEFIYDNLMIAANVVDAARRYHVEKLMFLGSTCIYPRMAPQPIPEDALLTGPLEPTNQWYAIAKIAGLKLCEAYRQQYGADFISVMPTNLYGPGDNFDLLSSHVLPALIAKAHNAKVNHKETLVVWGSGQPLREFLYVDDAADGMVYLMKHYSEDRIINLGTGQEITIADLVEIVTRVVGFSGTICYDGSKPDGTPRKVTDTQRLNALGWRARTSLEAGIARTYAWYLDHLELIRDRELKRA